MLSAVSWTGMGDGTSWSDPNNWSGNALPSSSDDVTINPTLAPNTTLTITHASGAHTINSLNSLNSQVNLDLSGGSLTVLNGGTVDGGLTTNGTIAIAAGQLEFDGGVTSVGGQFTVAAGAELGLGGPVVSLDAASSVTGAGQVGIGGASCTVDGVYDVSGGTGVGGSVTFLQSFAPASGNSLGAVLKVGGSLASTVTFAEGGDFTVQQLTLESATLIGPTDSSASPMQITVTDPGSPSGGLFSVSASSSAEFQGPGTLTVAADASMQIDANSFQLDGWTLDDSGPATVSGDTMFGALLGDSQWINRGTLAISTDFYLAGTGTFTNDGTFENVGVNDSEASLRALDGIDGIPAFVNYGSVVADGPTNFDGGVTSVGGQFTVAAGAELGLGGPVVSLDAASSVTGAGQVGIGGASCTVDGVYDVSGGTGVGGSVTFLQSFTPASGNSLGAILKVGGSLASTVTFAEGGDFTVQQLTLESGTLIGPTDSSASPMQITVTDPGSPSGGLFSTLGTETGFEGQGTLTVAADASVQIASSPFELDGWTLDDSGTTTVPGSGGATQLSLLDGAQWINRGSVTIDGSGNYYFFGDGAFINDGTFNVTGGSTVDFAPAAGVSGVPSFDNEGTVIVQSGNLQLGGAVTSGGSGSGDVRPFTSIAPSFQVDSGATLFLSGTVTASVVSSISVVGNPPGMVTYFLTGGNGSVQLSNNVLSLADTVTLQQSGPNGTVSVTNPISNPVVIGSVGLTLDTNGNPVTLTGGVSGGTTDGMTTGLTVTGAGLFALDSSNSYTGGTTVENGSLATEANGSLGASASTGVSGPLTVVASGNSATSTATVDSVETISGLSGTATGSGAAAKVMIGSGDSLTVDQSTASTFAGAIANSGVFTVSGAGSLFVGAVTGLGNIVVNGGAGLTADSFQGGSLTIGAGSTVTIDSSDAAGNPQVGVDSGQGTMRSGQGSGGTAAVLTAEASATPTAAESTVGEREAAAFNAHAPITVVIDAALTPALSHREREKMPAAPAIGVTPAAGQARGATADAAAETAVERASWFAMIGGEFHHESSRTGLFGAAGMVDSPQGVAGVDDALLDLLAEGVMGRWGAGG